MKGTCMYFVDTLSGVFTSKSEPRHLLYNDITIAALDIMEDDLAWKAKETQKDETLKEVIKHVITG